MFVQQSHLIEGPGGKSLLASPWAAKKQCFVLAHMDD